MSWNNRVIWSEGLFLRPQHFQQADRYLERLIRSRADGLRPYAWGLRDLKLNRDMLSLGKIALQEADGVLEDGTPFTVPDEADHPLPLEPPETTRNAVVYLTLPAYQQGAPEVEADESAETIARYKVQEQEVRDSNSGSRAPAEIEVGRLRLKLLLENAERSGLVSLGICRIQEIRADKQIVLDESFIPATLDCGSSKNLGGFLAEIQGLLHHRGEALGGRVSDAGTKGAAEIADFLLLQAVNRWEPLFSHLTTAADIHPETFFAAAVQLAGELCTFTATNKRPPAFPTYRHDDLTATFTPVMRSIRGSLSAVLEQTAVPIPLQERKYGVRVAQILDKTLLTGSVFVLAVKASIEAEQLRRGFPTQVKIGPVEKIRELVNVALPGIPVRAMPVAPRQIPYHVGTTYFELERASPYWKEMQTSGGLAVFVAGEFPGLDMELWAIRGR